MNIIESMEWRHAAKAMNGKQVPQKAIENILEAISLSPSSIGLQAYKVFVIENKELKERIRSVANNQQTITGCSHLLVFAARTEIATKDYDSYFDLMKSTRGKDDEYISNYRTRIEGFVNLRVGDKEPYWLVCQTYIGLGVACVAAANEKVDSVPIEGFDSQKVDEILSLKEKGYKSTLLLPLGYSDEEEDWWAKEKKIRKATSDFIEVIK